MGGEVRKATYDDLDYFIEAGRDFCLHTPFSFDADSYGESVKAILANPDCLAYVTGTGHSVALLVPNFYNSDEIIAKVFTTWGKGGLKCFREVEKQSRAKGAKFIMADSYIQPRVIKFYERIGMRLADWVYIKDL